MMKLGLINLSSIYTDLVQDALQGLVDELLANNQRVL
jgi:hypothetical protein